MHSRVQPKGNKLGTVELRQTSCSKFDALLTRRHADTTYPDPPRARVALRLHLLVLEQPFGNTMRRYLCRFYPQPGRSTGGRHQLHTFPRSIGIVAADSHYITRDTTHVQHNATVHEFADGARSLSIVDQKIKGLPALPVGKLARDRRSLCNQEVHLSPPRSRLGRERAMRSNFLHSVHNQFVFTTHDARYVSRNGPLGQCFRSVHLNVECARSVDRRLRHG